MVWSAQRLASYKVSPLWARVLAWHAPKTALGKPQPRAVPAVVLYKSLRPLGALNVGTLRGGGHVKGFAGRRTTREFGADGRWAPPRTRAADLGRRRPKLEFQWSDAYTDDGDDAA